MVQVLKTRMTGKDQKMKDKRDAGINPEKNIGIQKIGS